MNYSQTGISNLALGRIGARANIVNVYENSPNAVKVLSVWDSIFQEVLSERDWKFAKIRVPLQLAGSSSFTGSIIGTMLTVSSLFSGAIGVGQTLCGSGILPSTIITAGSGSSWTVSQAQNISNESMTTSTQPLYTFKYAWALPADLLRFVRPRKLASNRRWFFWGWGPEGTGWYRRDDPPFWPNEEYKVETLPIDGNRYALTNYGGWWGPAMITYIRLISDYTQLMPGFVNCLANRLAMELSIGITEDKNKFELMKTEYRESLNAAEAQNECLDFSEDESGSTTWEDAGRVIRYW